MKRRKLNPDDGLQDQFAALRQIVSLTQSECRQIVSLLHDDDAGRKTCSRAKHVHPLSLPCLRELQIPTDNSNMTLYCMSLPALIQTKIDTCPLFKACCAQALRGRRHGELRFVLYADDTQGGNTLAAPATRKTTLVYGIFLDFPMLYLESLWLCLSAVKATDVSQCNGGLATIISTLMSFYKSECQHGMTISVDDDPTLIFITHFVLLSDHEGLRAALGSKGAAGIKCCLKCVNILGLGRHHGVHEHYDITCPHVANFKPMTQAMVEQAAQLLEQQPTKQKLEEAERLLGFNLEILRESPLLKPCLRDMFNLSLVHYDSMHEYYSNGIISQQLGLWFDQMLQLSHAKLEQLQAYVKLGWRATPGGHQVAPKPETLFTEKLFKKGKDYRGDAQACMHALPLCVAFGEEVLRGACAAMIPALDSLQNLHAVVLCIQHTKRNPKSVDKLLDLKKRHMISFQLAHPENQRPKLHYALHITEQVKQHGVLLDVFCCERKHRQFKSLCASNFGQPGKQSFAKAILLQLVSQDIATPLCAEMLNTHLGNKCHANENIARALGSSEKVWLSSNVTHKGIRYGRNQFVLFTKSIAAEILGVLKNDNQHMLLVDVLKPVHIGQAGRSCWQRAQPSETSTYLIAITNDFNANVHPAMYQKHDATNKVWLLQ